MTVQNHPDDQRSRAEPVGPEPEETASERPRVRLRARYEAAMTAVTLDLASAVADYEQSLADLIAARRARGD